MELALTSRACWGQHLAQRLIMLGQRINYGQYQECKLRFKHEEALMQIFIISICIAQIDSSICQREKSCLEGGIGRKGSVCCFCLILLHSGKILEMRVSYILLLGNKQTFCQKNVQSHWLRAVLSLCIEVMPKTTSPETPSVAGVRLNASLSLPVPTAASSSWWERSARYNRGVWLADNGDGGTSGAGAVCPGMAVSSRGPCETKQEQVITQTTRSRYRELSPLGNSWVSQGLGKWSWRSRGDLLGADEVIMGSVEGGGRIIWGFYYPWSRESSPVLIPGRAVSRSRLLRASLHCTALSEELGPVSPRSFTFF